jgi:hypothetical protein
MCQYKILAWKAAIWREVMHGFSHYFKERAGIPLQIRLKLLLFMGRVA